MIEQPPYSPNLAMCAFWLCFNLKMHLRGCLFLSDEIDVAIHNYFESIPENNWRAAFKEWKETYGDYFEHMKHEA